MIDRFLARSGADGCRRRLPGLIGGLLLLLIGSGGATADTWQIDPETFNPDRPPQLAVGADGTAWAGYYDHKGHIMVRPGQGEAVILNPTPGQGPPSGLVLKAIGNRLYAVWRERRQEGLALVLRIAEGGAWGEPVVVDNSTRPLTRIVLSGDPQGPLYVAWLGQSREPAPPAGPAAAPPGQGYYIYARYSPDGGKTWGEVRNLTAPYERSIWPTLLTQGDKAYSFSWSEGGGKKRLVFTKTVQGNAWQTPTVIKEVGDVLLLEPQRVGERLLVLWLDRSEAGGQNVFVFEGAFSDDEGARWTTFTLDDTRVLDAANLAVAFSDRDVYAVFGARPAKATSGEPWKQTVYFAHSPDGGTTWDKLKRLRHYPFSYTNALHPRVLAEPGGKVTVVWNDHRNIRGDLYFNYSDNAGADWLPADLAIDTRGAAEDFLYPSGALFQKAGEGYYLLAGQRPDSAAPRLLLHRFNRQPAEPARDLLNDPGSPEKAALLRERAARFWQALVSAEYANAYPLFDPFFRAGFRQVDYLAASGRIVYHSFQIGEIQVYGNVGQVRVDYTYEIPRLVTAQGAFSRPRTTASVTETWLFVGDAWYKEYRHELGEFSYARY